MANNASSVLAIARAEIGYSRWTDNEPGTKYGRWYESTIDRCSTNYDFGGNGVPFCAMFVSWVKAKAGSGCAGVPGAYCPSMLSIGKAKGRAVPVKEAQPGDVVYFDWEGDGVSDHVGFVEVNFGTYLQTIEGNTNNGQVARRTRAYGTVCGVIRPDYDGADKPSGQPVGGSTPCAVDGFWGTATTKAVQAALGTSQDGIVSDQYAPYAAKNPGLQASSWQWRAKTTQGSDMVRAMQRKVGAGVDGIAGPATFKALQKHLGTYQDGIISSPSNAVKELQRRLSAGTF
ncbi:MAG: CHAP domain-containing protein [Gordonibacter sp.]